MKIKLLALGLVSGLFTLSAAATLCPESVTCIDNGNGPVCTSTNLGSPFTSTPFNMVNLPVKGKAYVFNFKMAGVSQMMKTHQIPQCVYDVSSVDNNHQDFVLFESNLNLTADTHSAGNNWSSDSTGIGLTCSGNVFQCPFVKVATK